MALQQRPARRFFVKEDEDEDTAPEAKRARQPSRAEASITGAGQRIPGQFATSTASPLSYAGVAAGPPPTINPAYLAAPKAQLVDLAAARKNHYREAPIFHGSDSDRLLVDQLLQIGQPQPAQGSFFAGRRQ